MQILVPKQCAALTIGLYSFPDFRHTRDRVACVRKDPFMALELPKLADDGLTTPSVGIWGLRKYRLISYFSGLFTEAMSSKWEALIYVDLFSGSGRASIKGQGMIVPGSPILAIDLIHRFSKYVFCDLESSHLRTLKTRVVRDYPGVSADYIAGDCNQEIDSIIAAIPRASREYKVLSFCVVDPFSLASIRFATLERLASRFVDFMILIPAYLDARRNRRIYLEPGNTTVDGFLGDPNWRIRWADAQMKGVGFAEFVADSFCLHMKQLRFAYGSLADTILVRDESRNLPLYRLAFFSRHELGVRFWKDSRERTREQLRLFR